MPRVTHIELNTLPRRITRRPRHEERVYVAVSAMEPPRSLLRGGKLTKSGRAWRALLLMVSTRKP